MPFREIQEKKQGKNSANLTALVNSYRNRRWACGVEDTWRAVAYWYIMSCPTKLEVDHMLIVEEGVHIIGQRHYFCKLRTRYVESSQVSFSLWLLWESVCIYRVFLTFHVKKIINFEFWYQFIPMFNKIETNIKVILILILITSEF